MLAAGSWQAAGRARAHTIGCDLPKVLAAFWLLVFSLVPPLALQRVLYSIGSGSLEAPPTVLGGSPTAMATSMPGRYLRNSWQRPTVAFGLMHGRLCKQSRRGIVSSIKDTTQALKYILVSALVPSFHGPTRHVCASREALVKTL